MNSAFYRTTCLLFLMRYSVRHLVSKLCAGLDSVAVDSFIKFVSRCSIALCSSFSSV